MRNRIAQMRKNYGLNQTQLAKKLNTTQANISSWENGKWQPDNETLIKLSIFFHCTIDYLLCKTDINIQEKRDPEEVECNNEEKLTEKQKELMPLIQMLNDRQCQRTYDYLSGMLDISAEEQKKWQA